MKYRIKSILLSLFVLITSFVFAQAPAKVIVTMNGALSNKVYFELLINNKVSFDSLALTNGTGTKEFVLEKPTSVKLFDHYSYAMVMELQKLGKKVKFTPISSKKGVQVRDESHDLLRSALIDMKFGMNEDHSELIIRPGETIQFTAKGGSLSVASVKGKADVENYSQLEQKLAPFKDKLLEIEENITGYPDKVDAKVYAKFDDQITEYKSKMYELAFDFIRNNASSEYAPKVAINYLPLQQKYMQQLPAIIPEANQKDPGYIALNRIIHMFKKVNVGTELPEFTAQDINGKPVKLSDYKGKLILLDFWASWCTPCRAENPYMQYIYDRYHSKGLEIIAFSVDDKIDAWKKAVTDDALTWPQVSDLKGIREGVAHDFEISGVPTNFLVKDGKVIGVFLRRQALNAMLQKELGK
jgi:thiol-disulfide isomerase/thioredoxin